MSQRDRSIAAPDDGRSDAATAAVADLLARRADDATVCPSEIARVLAADGGANDPDAWRQSMPTVHAAIDRLAAAGLVRLSWQGKLLSGRRGPYRIGRGPRYLGP